MNIITITENVYSMPLSVLLLMISAYKFLEWRRTKLQKKTVDFPVPEISVSPQSHPCCNDNLTSFAFVGLDCEMVGTGRGGFISLLARCSIVTLKDDGKIHVVYDKIVQPTKKVTDYRTKYSGITKELLQGKTVSFEKCQSEVNEIFASYEGKQCVVVGHALRNDFDVLKIRYPSYLVRDTATYPRFMRTGRRPQKLRHLVYEHLGQRIQGSSDGHSSVEDAAAVLMLYRKFQAEWEKSLGYPLNKLEARKLHRFRET